MSMLFAFYVMFIRVMNRKKRRYMEKQKKRAQGMARKKNENDNEDENKDKEEVNAQSVTTQTPVVEQAPTPDSVPSQAFQPQTYQQYYNPAQPYRADGPTQMESYVSPQTNPTPPQYVSPQESDVKPTMSSSKPLIFRTRMDPNLLIYEYSDRLVFYKKTLNGLEHVKTERKDPLK